MKVAEHSKSSLVRLEVSHDQERDSGWVQTYQIKRV